MASTSARLLHLLSLLTARQHWTGPLLAERLEISPRTLRRDIDDLRALGYNVQPVKGPAGGYRLLPGAAMPPLLFDDRQAVALAVALQTMRGMGDDLDEAARQALITTRQVLPERLRHRLDQIAVTALPPRPHAEVPLDLEVLEIVSQACAMQQELTFSYAREDRETGHTTRRRVEPHHLINRQRRWYLVAWDLDQDDWRIFRLDRMSPSPPLGRRFVAREVPGGDAGQFVTARFKGVSPGEDWPCLGMATLQIPASDVVPYLDDEVVEPLPNGHCRLTAGSWSWRALAARLLTFDAEIVEVTPEALRLAYGDLAQRCTRATR